MLKKPQIDIAAILQECEAFIDGHFELAGGRHVQSYVDTAMAMQYPSIASKIAKALMALFDKKIDAVLSPTAENSILAQEVARVAGCRSLFASDEDGVMKLRGATTINPKESVLIVDNVTMSGRKVEEAVSLVKMLKGNVVGVAVIVDRSSAAPKSGVPLRALLHYPLDTYAAEDCPLCKAGVELKRKGKQK